MKARILPPEEWGRVESDLSQLLPFTHPRNVAVVVVEDDAGEIVASCAALQITHFEGLWIKPEERSNAGVIRSLIRLLYAVPQARGEKWALGGASDTDEKMKTLCHRLGGHEWPVRFFTIPVGE